MKAKDQFMLTLNI